MTLKKYIVFSVLAVLAVFLWLFPESRTVGWILALGVGSFVFVVAYFAVAAALFKRMLRAFNRQPR